MRALPSYYASTVFRSRIEARWAAFFDLVGLRWEYEPEGFMLSDGTRYLPDFWLPEMQMWAEVKPRDRVLDEERKKIELLVEGSAMDCALLAGAPHPVAYEVCCPEGGAARWAMGCFTEKYVIKRHDGAPRFFWQPADYEPGNDDLIAKAMAKARSTNVRDPEASEMAPLGLDQIPVVSPGPNEFGFRGFDGGMAESDTDFWVWLAHGNDRITGGAA